MKIPDSNSSHLLVVDDDARLRSLLQRYLTRDGYWCSCARDAGQVTELTRIFRFDLIVMDVMMPGMDGITLTGQIRRMQDVPIIILSAKTELADRMEGFGAGADDYVSKPYEPTELVARIEAVLRRSRSGHDDDNPSRVTFGKYEFDPYRGQLRKGIFNIHLTEFEQKMLRRLSQTPNRAVRREEFTEMSGDTENPVLSRAVDVRVSRLRQKLETDARRPRFLITVRNEGYMLVAD